MTDKAIFRVNHPTGSYEIVVSEFFGTADKTKIKKLLRIAAQHCTEAQQADLIRDLTTEHDRCVKALDKLDVLIAEQQQVISGFFGLAQYRGLDILNGTIRAIARRRDKLMWTRNLVTKARWVG